MPRLSCVDSSIIISLTDSFELSFYLKKFCAEKTDGIRAGDILTVVSEERLKHAAIAMDSETIFEKPSVSGREGKGDPKWVAAHPEDGNYRTIRRKDSRWFSGYGESSEGTRVVVHRCVSPDVAREQLAEMRRLPSIQLAERIRRSFETIATRKSQLNWNEYDMLRQDILRFAGELNKLDGTKESDQLAHALNTSIWQNLIFLNKESELTPEFQLAFEKLEVAGADLRDRIEAYALEADGGGN